MAAFSPPAAALEGFRLVWREPRAVLVWIGLWVGALLISAIALVITGQPVAVARHAHYRSFADIASHFGPFAALLITLFLLIWAMTTVATFRAVLAPDERRAFYLRLGPDEARLAVLTVVALVVGILLGGVPAFLLFVLVSPLMAAAPTSARDVATAGAAATVALDIWLAVRLSLIAVETFAERRFHLTAYWPLARGRFWYLLLAYFLCFGIFFVFLVIFGVVGGVLAEIQHLVGAPVGFDPGRRGALYGLAAIAAVVPASFFVVSTILFCACQAHAYAAIVRGGDIKPAKKVRTCR